MSQRVYSCYNTLLDHVTVAMVYGVWNTRCIVTACEKVTFNYLDVTYVQAGANQVPVRSHGKKPTPGDTKIDLFQGRPSLMSAYIVIWTFSNRSEAQSPSYTSCIRIRISWRDTSVYTLQATENGTIHDFPILGFNLTDADVDATENWVRPRFLAISGLPEKAIFNHSRTSIAWPQSGHILWEPIRKFQTLWAALDNPSTLRPFPELIVYIISITDSWVTNTCLGLTYTITHVWTEAVH